MSSPATGSRRLREPSSSVTGREGAIGARTTNDEQRGEHPACSRPGPLGLRGPFQANWVWWRIALVMRCASSSIPRMTPDLRFESHGNPMK